MQVCVIAMGGTWRDSYSIAHSETEATTQTHTVEKRLVVGIEGRMPCIVENRLALGVWRIGRKSEVQNDQEIEEKRPNLLR